MLSGMTVVGAAYGRVFAALYDPVLAVAERAGLTELRRTVLAGARGRVIEIGAGTGLNLPLYPAGVERIVVTEPDSLMLQRLHRRTAGAPAPVELALAHAEQLPFADRSFDTAVSTLALCTVADVVASTRELRRVLRPDGQLLLLEHIRADTAGLASWQDRVAPAWQRLARGCRCNLDTVAALEQAGFDVADLERRRWRGIPPVLSPLAVGTAVPG